MDENCILEVIQSGVFRREASRYVEQILLTDGCGWVVRNLSDKAPVLDELFYQFVIQESLKAFGWDKILGELPTSLHTDIWKITLTETAEKSWSEEITSTLLWLSLAVGNLSLFQTVVRNAEDSTRLTHGS